MKGYKAFSKGLVCRGKRYAENTVFEEESAEICKIGMHFCKNPLDTLDFTHSLIIKVILQSLRKLKHLTMLKRMITKNFAPKS